MDGGVHIYLWFASFLHPLGRRHSMSSHHRHLFHRDKNFWAAELFASSSFIFWRSNCIRNVRPHEDHHLIIETIQPNKQAKSKLAGS
ncbi:Uncharacterized protein APZ42_026794 [Daphnia magna]|uniref:Uncharacterized protein n=1 Tax=Daphnia magna TaxID=35525 RepID=A0A164RXQ4_9CRUS|nr:Uncharacterized protein APZ42_026794 [Daphnia magna]